MAYIAPPNRGYILNVVPKKHKGTSSHVHTHVIQAIEYYQLKNGDQFRLKGKVYKKLDEDFAMRGKKKVHFWPQDSVRLMKNMNLEEYNETYPMTQYEY